MKIWISSGSIKNWKVALEEGGIWGVSSTSRLKSLWEEISEGDLLAFYVSAPISGVIGFGKIVSKSEENKPLWPNEKEKGEVLYPCRFRFNIIECLDRENWETDNIRIGDLKLRRSSGLNPVKNKDAGITMFQRTDVEWETNLARLVNKEIERKPEEKSPHEEVKTMLYDIGVREGMTSKKEYNLNGGLLDVVWIKKGVKKAVPKVAFEVHMKGSPHTALGKLKDANDRWNSKPVIIAKKESEEKINELLGGMFHEIHEKIKIWTPEDVQEIHELEKKLSKIKRKKTLTGLLD